MDIVETIDRMRRLRSDLPDVEVKSALNGLPDSITESLCAFANLPGGGLLLLGLDEAAGFAPVHLPDAAGLAAGVASRARQAFEPPVNLDVTVEEFEGAQLVVARIYEIHPSAKPCIVRRSGNAYMRFSDGDYVMSQLEIDAFIVSRDRPRFDEEPVVGARFDDFDADVLASYVATARAGDPRLASLADDDAVLLRTGAMTRERVPTAAGLLALGTYPQQFFPQFAVRAALLPDEAGLGTRALDSATFTGPLPVILDSTVEWVRRNSRRRLVTNLDTGHTREVIDPPPAAIREFVANALVHRDLADWAASRSIELRLDGSEFRLTNPGGLYGITTAQLGVKPLSSARNRRLIEICKFLQTENGSVVEALASGIPTALAALDESAMQRPRFFDQGLSFTVTIDRRVTTPLASKDDPPAGDRPNDMTNSEAKLLNVLTTPATASEIARAAGISLNAAQKRLASLRKKGVVVMSDHQGQRTKYRRA
jgi:ATP-dependent DNA helicase RecG